MSSKVGSLLIGSLLLLFFIRDAKPFLEEASNAFQGEKKEATDTEKSPVSSIENKKDNKETEVNIGRLMQTTPATCEDPVMGYYCARSQDAASLKNCLENYFSGDRVKDLVWPQDDLYDKARTTYFGNRYPAAYVYAENTMDVSEAVRCAYENGFQASARGGGHSFQGWGVADGAVIIDMTHTCKPDEFQIEKFLDTPRDHILPGSKYIALVKAGAGCTNSLMNSATYQSFEQGDGALSLIGSCPAVGVAGFVLGGGQGDVTPYVGLAADVLAEAEVVLYDGSVVIASEHENEDLFWSIRGGGGGIGLITSLTFKVVQAPTPSNGLPRRFTYLTIHVDEDETLASRFQKFLYSKDISTTSKFGGGANLSQKSSVIDLLYLGPWQDAIQDLRNANLLEKLTTQVKTTLVENYELVCGFEDTDLCNEEDHGIPSTGVFVHEFETQQEMQAHQVCKWLKSPMGLLGAWTNRTLDICEDLAIDSEEFCIDRTDGLGVFGFNDPVCYFKPVIDAFLQVGLDPDSFLSHFGFPDHLRHIFGVTAPPQLPTQLAPGGLVPNKLEKSTIDQMARISFLLINHLSHGAPMRVDHKATAYPWRSSAMLFFLNNDFPLSELLKDKSIEGDLKNLQGFYNYLGATNMYNWERHYFGDNWERLQHIKAKYDPYGVFTKPMTVYTGPESTKSGKGDDKRSRSGKNDNKKTKKGKGGK